MAILGLDVVIGFSGQLVLGQSAFVGLGAYTTVILVADHHWSFFAALPATTAVCFVAGLLVGIPATRVKGVYLAIVTLVLAAVFPSLVLRLTWLTGGANGKGTPRTQGKMLPPSWLPFADDRPSRRAAVGLLHHPRRGRRRCSCSPATSCAAGRGGR